MRVPKSTSPPWERLGMFPVKKIVLTVEIGELAHRSARIVSRTKQEENPCSYVFNRVAFIFMC